MKWYTFLIKVHISYKKTAKVWVLKRLLCKEIQIKKKCQWNVSTLWHQAPLSWETWASVCCDHKPNISDIFAKYVRQQRPCYADNFMILILPSLTNTFKGHLAMSIVNCIEHGIVKAVSSFSINVGLQHFVNMFQPQHCFKKDFFPT